MTSTAAASRGKGRRGKPDSSGQSFQMTRAKVSKPQKVEPLVKEEGEMSDTEEVYEQFKEVKWREWCEDVMADEEKTLKRLQRLQSTSADLPKEKVIFSYPPCRCLFPSSIYVLIEFSPKIFISGVI